MLAAVQFGDRLSTAGENAAAFVSGHCSSGNPKVKWFALERSPNVSHLILSHGSPKSRQDISATCFNRCDRYDFQEVLTFLREGD